MTIDVLDAHTNGSLLYSSFLELPHGHHDEGTFMLACVEPEEPALSLRKLVPRASVCFRPDIEALYDLVLSSDLVSCSSGLRLIINIPLNIFGFLTFLEVP